MVDLRSTAFEAMKWTDPFVVEMQKRLGMPPRVSSFTVVVEVGEPVRVSCDYYPPSTLDSITEEK